MARAGGFAVLRVLAETFLGRALSLAGRQGEAVTVLEDSGAYAESIQFRAAHALNLAWLADAHLRAGRVAHAMTAIDRALEATRAHRQPAAEAEVFLTLAAIHAAGGHPDLEAARTAAQQAISLADDLGARPLVARGHLTLGQLSRQAGASEEARSHFALAAGMFASMGMEYWLEQVEA
jgi:tetratricopeptide (TPR) repeat protein